MTFVHDRRLLRRLYWIGALATMLAVASIASARAARSARSGRTARTAGTHAALQIRWLEINNLTLPVSNYGQHGQNKAENRAGGEWPSGSGEYYIFGAGIWISGTVDQASFATADAGRNGGNPFYTFEPSTTNPLGWRGFGKVEGGTNGSRDVLTDPRVAVGYEPSGGTEELASLTPLYFSTDSDWPLPKTVSILDSYAECDDQDPQRWDTGSSANSGKDATPPKWSGTPTDATIAQYGLGVKVEQTTYSWNYASNQDIHFVLYEIENIRADGKDINNCFLGVVCDPDVGNESTDDMAGFDPTRDLGYAYDSDFSEQEFSGVPGFVGYRFLRSPVAEIDIDKNADGVINDNPVTINGIDVYDVKKGQEIGLHSYKIFGRIAGDPENEWERYMVMAGHNFSEDQPQLYQPYDLSNTPEDQRFLQTTGPFTLKPGQPVHIAVAIMAANAAGNASDPISVRVSELQRVSDVAQSIFNNNFLLPVPPKAPTLTVRAGDRKAYLTWDNAAETTPDAFYPITSDPASSLYDPTYKQYDFEGYRVWKSLTGRSDDWQLVAQYDIRSMIPRQVDIRIDGGVYGGNATYDAATSEDYFRSNGGDALWSNHQYLVTIDSSKKVKVYDVNLNGAEIPSVTEDDEADYWYSAGDLPAKFELFDSDLNSLSADSARNADGTYDEYVPGMLVYLGGMAIQFDACAAPTSMTIWRITPSNEEDYGANTSLAHAYVDSPLVNGRLYYYAVTAYDFQLSSPRSLESGKLLSTGSVVPRSNPLGMTTPRITTATHKSGRSDGAITLSIADPTKITGHTYQVSFKDDATWFVRDINKAAGQDTVVKNIANQSGDFNYPIVDGILVNVVGPDLGIDKLTYAPSANKWYADVNGTMLGLEFSGSALGPADYVTVEVRFSTTSTSKAPMYLRGGTPNYGFGGVGTFPGEVWDVTSDPPRRLAVAFVEQAGAATQDLKWMPDPSSLGGREYLFILNQPYDDNTSSTAWDAFRSEQIYYDAPDLPILYVSWINAKTDESNNARTPTNGDKWTIKPYFVNTRNDVFEYSTAAEVTADSLIDLKKIMVVPNPFIVRHELMPNKDNPSIMFANVPPNCVIRIYTLAGDLVDIVEHNTGTDAASASGTAVWDLRNSNFQRIASGLYLFQVDDKNGHTYVGKFAVVR